MICKIAKDLAEACALAHRDKDNKIPKGTGPSCLLPETRILTKSGWEQIKNVRAGDYVLTRQGWRKVIWSGCTGIKEIGVFDKKLVCTNDHPIKSGDMQIDAGMFAGTDIYDALPWKECRKWTRLGTLEALMADMSERLNSLFGATGYSTGPSTRNRVNIVSTISLLLENAEAVKAKGCMLRYGNIITALCLTGLLSTTRTSILTITILRILNVLVTKIMSGCTAGGGIRSIRKNLASALTVSGRPRTNGIEARKGEGSLKKPDGVFGRLLRSVLLHALSVEEGFNHALYKASLNTVVITAKRPRCGENGKAYQALTKIAEVWDISVDGAHEFCAEGIFVSNSPIHAIDGLRYVCSFICMRDKAFRDIRNLIIDKRASFRPDSGKLIQDLGSGYVQIHPNALYQGKKL
jgi:hypothetical protein